MSQSEKYNEHVLQQIAITEMGTEQGRHFQLYLLLLKHTFFHSGKKRRSRPAMQDLNSANALSLCFKERV